MCGYSQNGSPAEARRPVTSIQDQVSSNQHPTLHSILIIWATARLLFTKRSEAERSWLEILKRSRDACTKAITCYSRVNMTVNCRVILSVAIFHSGSHFDVILD